MPQAFTDQQMEEIRQKLFQSACRHAVETGVRKTSMEALTQDAGISKSTFYKFYESKEILFLQVAQHFEELVIGEMKRVLRGTAGQASKARTAAAVNAAFGMFAGLGAIRFFREDMPELAKFIHRQRAAEHFKDIAEKLLETLEQEQISFREPPATVKAVIQLLYQSLPSISEMENFVDAMHVLVMGACDRLVA